MIFEDLCLFFFSTRRRCGRPLFSQCHNSFRVAQKEPPSPPTDAIVIPFIIDTLPIVWMVIDVDHRHLIEVETGIVYALLVGMAITKVRSSDAGNPQADR